MLGIVALFATTNTVLISLVSGSRILYGMARQGTMPTVFARIHRKTGTPWTAVLLIMTLSIAFAFIGDVETVASITVFTVVAIFALVNLSLLRLRYKRAGAERPFKTPLNIGRFPVLAVLGLTASIIGVSQLNASIVLIGLGVIAVSTLSHLALEKYRKV